MLVCTQDIVQLTLCKPLSFDGALARHAGQALGAPGRPQSFRYRNTLRVLCLRLAPLVAKMKLAELSNAIYFILRRVGLSLYANATAVRADERACQPHLDERFLILDSGLLCFQSKQLSSVFTRPLSTTTSLQRAISQS